MIFKVFFTIALFVIGGIVAYKLIKNPKLVVILKKIGLQIINDLIPSGMGKELSGLTKQTYRVLNDSAAISDLLLYSHYVEEDDVGIYVQRNNRKGFIFEIQPPPFLGESIEQTLRILFSTIQRDDLVIQFNCYASSNIQEQLDAYKQAHINPGKIDHPNVMKNIIDDRIEHYSKWSKTSTMGNNGDFRIRNFYNLVSVLFPPETPLAEIKKQFREMKGMLVDMQPKNFRADKLLVFLHELLAPGQPITTKEVDLHRKMNDQFAKGVNINIFEDDPVIHIDKSKVFAQVLTTEKFPKELDISDFQAAFFDPFGLDFQIAMPCRFLCSLTVHMENNKLMQKEVLEHCRHNLKHTGKIGYDKKEQYPEVYAVREEAKEVISYIEEMSETPYTAMWNLVLFDDDRSKLESCVAMIKKRFMQINTTWELREESFSNIALMELIHSLPLQFYQPAKYLLRHRFDRLFKSNNATIAPLVSDFKGFGNYYNLYVGRTGQLIRIDPFASRTNYNMIVVGPPGSGKSMFANDFLAQCIAAGWRVWMMDLGDSYENINQQIGGQYLKFREDSNICLNFFTHINTKKVKVGSAIRFHGNFEFPTEGKKDKNGLLEMIHEDEFDTIIPMIGIMAGLKLRSTNNYENDQSTDDDITKKTVSAVLESAVTLAFLRNGRNAGMKDVFDLLREMAENAYKVGQEEIGKICEQTYNLLFAYGEPAGKFYRYYNGAFNIDMENWFFVLEQEELKNKGELIEVVAFGILQRIAQISFLEQNRRYKKLIAFDESAPLLKSELFAHYFDDFSRRIRKYNGALMLITQYIGDFFWNKRSASLYEGAAYRFLLEHDASQIEKVDVPDKMPMDEFTKELLKSVKKRDPYYSELMIQHRDLSVVVRLIVTPTEYALYTTNPQDRKFREDLEKRLGLSRYDALFMFARRMAGDTEDAALRALSERSAGVNKKYWEKKIRYAIAKNTVEVFTQPVVDGNGEVAFFEALMRIRDEKGEIFTPDKFYKIAEKTHQDDMLEAKFLDRCFGFFENIEIDFSINVSTNMLKNHEMVEALIQKAKKFNIIEKLIVEVEVHSADEKLMDALKRLKSQHIRIAIDRVNVKNINLHQYLVILPEFIKIDGHLIQGIQNKDFSEQTEIIKLISERLNIKTVAVHVSDKLIFNQLLNSGIEYFQGYYIAEPDVAQRQVGSLMYSEKVV